MASSRGNTSRAFSGVVTACALLCGAACGGRSALEGANAVGAGGNGGNATASPGGGNTITPSGGAATSGGGGQVTPTDMRTAPDPLRNPPRTCTADGWCGALGDYTAIWGSSLFDIWIAANHVESTAANPVMPDTSVLLHWDGLEWTTVEPLDATQLSSIWGSSSTDVWVTGAPTHILHFDGERWSRSLLPSDAGVYLTTIWGAASNDVWTGGAGLFHFDGSAWSPRPSEQTDWFTSGWSTPGDLWVMNGTHPERSRDAGASWSAAPSAGRMNDWTAVWGANAGAPFIAGMKGALGRWQTDGWIVQTVSGASDPLSFRAISGLSSSDVWAVGDSGAVAHWNGANWTQETSPTRESLHGVWGTNGHVFAVGDHGVFVELKSTESVTNQPSNSEINAIWGAAPDDVWAIGKDSVHWDGTSWSKAAGLTGLSLTGVWGSATNDVWAIGSGGVILHFDGAGWAPTTTPTTADLTGIWGSAANDVWAVATSGDFLHFDGKTWELMLTEDFGPLAAIHGNRADNVIAVGDVSRARFDGRAWQRIPDNPLEHPHYVSAFGDGSDVFMGGMVTWSAYKAGGAHPELGRWDGASAFDNLEPMWNGDGVVKCGWASEPTNVWIALPTLMHWNGSSWMRTALTQSLGVTAIGATTADIWIAVSGGQILRKARD